MADLVWCEKEHGSKYRAQSRLDVWELADWIHCVSGQAEHLCGHESYFCGC